MTRLIAAVSHRCSSPVTSGVSPPTTEAVGGSVHTWLMPPRTLRPRKAATLSGGAGGSIPERGLDRATIDRWKAWKPRHWDRKWTVVGTMRLPKWGGAS
jgi:hypothetical protein